MVGVAHGLYHSKEEENFFSGQLSCPDQVLLTEWSLLPRVLEAICEVFGQ